MVELRLILFTWFLFQMDRWNTAEARNISIGLIEVWVVSITYTGMTLQC